jgi:hypothetical protein
MNLDVDRVRTASELKIIEGLESCESKRVSVRRSHLQTNRTCCEQTFRSPGRASEHKRSET